MTGNTAGGDPHFAGSPRAAALAQARAAGCDSIPAPHPMNREHPAWRPRVEPKLDVLLVDDSHIALDRLEQQIAELEGLAIVGVASNRAAAVRLAREASPDLVLMDMGMPGLDALSALLARSSPRSPGCRSSCSSPTRTTRRAPAGDPPRRAAGPSEARGRRRAGCTRGVGSGGTTILGAGEARRGALIPWYARPPWSGRITPRFCRSSPKPVTRERLPYSRRP
ncbi:MAG: response regulator transcription factor [Myxococcota bacterium]